MKNTKGFTLIELAVVLAIIAVLAAILTPMALNYLDQARVSRAMADASTIAQAVTLFKRDTGYYPVYTSLASAKAGTTAYGTLASAGTAPSVGTGGLGWSSALGGSNTNGVITTALNTSWSDMTQNAENPGKTSYRGPYIGALDSDPWGNQYLVTGMTTITGVTSGGHAFVISAGPNGTLDTSAYLTGTAITAGGDDIIVPLN